MTSLPYQSGNCLYLDGNTPCGSAFYGYPIYTGSTPYSDYDTFVAFIKDTLNTTYTADSFASKYGCASTSSTSLTDAVSEIRYMASYLCFYYVTGTLEGNYCALPTVAGSGTSLYTYGPLLCNDQCDLASSSYSSVILNQSLCPGEGGTNFTVNQNRYKTQDLALKGCASQTDSCCTELVAAASSSAAAQSTSSTASKSSASSAAATSAGSASTSSAAAAAASSSSSSAVSVSILAPSIAAAVAVVIGAIVLIVVFTRRRSSDRKVHLAGASPYTPPPLPDVAFGTFGNRKFPPQPQPQPAAASVVMSPPPPSFRHSLLMAQPPPQHDSYSAAANTFTAPVGASMLRGGEQPAPSYSFPYGAPAAPSSVGSVAASQYQVQQPQRMPYHAPQPIAPTPYFASQSASHGTAGAPTSPEAGPTSHHAQPWQPQQQRREWQDQSSSAAVPQQQPPPPLASPTVGGMGASPQAAAAAAVAAVTAARLSPAMSPTPRRSSIMKLPLPDDSTASPPASSGATTAAAVVAIATGPSPGPSPSITSSSGAVAPLVMRVLHPYAPTLNDELELAVGQDVIVLRAFDDGWGLGVTPSNGAQGAFPLVCVTSGVASASDGASSVASEALSLASGDPAEREKQVRLSAMIRRSSGRN
ncbi:hypothetical protein HK405_007729 [Cladochytrium tenue]|nr:hypothetical protein HK405_007729 [Cladochytrium tenue]